jgi:uroporphyrinogen-III synthase
MSTPSGEPDRVLQGKLIAVPETRQLDVLASLLERRGADVLRCPLVGIADAPDAAPVIAWIERLIAKPTDLVVFYTGEGVDRLRGFARRAGIEPAFVDALKRTPKLTRGPKPKRALREIELTPEYSATEPTTAGLIATARAIPAPLRRVAIQLYSETQAPELRGEFERRGIETDCVAPYVYASAADDDRVAGLIAELAAGRIAAIAFTSKAQVARLLDVAQERGLASKLLAGLSRTRVAAVGPVVSAELAAAGVRVDAMPAESYTMKPLVTSLCELLGPGS